MIWYEEQSNDRSIAEGHVGMFGIKFIKACRSCCVHVLGLMRV